MLATNNTNLCVLGTENNERNCGYGSSVSQLCRFCSNDRPDSCCYEDATNILPCGYTLPSRPSSTTSLNLPTASMRNAPAKTIKGGLTKGQVAGIAVGSVLGGLLVSLLPFHADSLRSKLIPSLSALHLRPSRQVLALLATLLFLLHRRRRDRRGPRTVDHPTAAAAGSSSAFSSPPTTPETTYPQSQTRRNSWFTSLFLAPSTQITETLTPTTESLLLPIQIQILPSTNPNNLRTLLPLHPRTLYRTISLLPQPLASSVSACEGDLFQSRTTGTLCSGRMDRSGREGSSPSSGRTRRRSRMSCR
jgi:hypothetical protein